MLMEQLLNTPAKWMTTSQDDRDIVLTSRIRLARNIDKTPFPGWATRQERAKIWEQATDAARTLTAMKGAYCFELSNMEQQNKQLLVERHLISRELAARGDSSGVMISKNQQSSIMFNEEDHFRIQAIYPGLQLKRAWTGITKIDSELESKIPYAYNSQLGYLTACPSNLGTGMRASAMLHLPGLIITEQMNKVMQAAHQLNMTIRGLYGEGTEATGNLVQISNQSTLGETEPTIIEQMNRFISDLCHQEWNARKQLLKGAPLTLKDRVGRAFGILTNASILPTKEALGLISFVRLGASLKMLDPGLLKEINSLILELQPAHIQRNQSSQPLTSETRDILRADIVRKYLGRFSLTIND